MNIAKYIALIISFIPQFSFAQSECTGIADDGARLACFDAAFNVRQIETESRLELGKWDKRVDISQLTDEKNVFLLLESENRVAGRYGGTGTGRLWLRCMENTTAVLMDFNDHFMSDINGGGRVQYRIDDLPMQTVSTTESNDNSSLGLWRGNSSIPFIKRLFGHDQLILRATPFNGNALTLTFDIRNVETAVEELRETCGW